MSTISKERKISIAGTKLDVRTQFGALCYRVKKSRTEFLLVTSRTTRRWIIPKGWPIEGLSPHKTAAVEAMEEAGVEGRVGKAALGIYTYRKYLTRKDWVPVAVAVYPVKVTDLRLRFKEANERKRAWMSPKKASRNVSEPELKRLLLNFDPKTLK